MHTAGRSAWCLPTPLSLGLTRRACFLSRSKTATVITSDGKTVEVAAVTERAHNEAPATAIMAIENTDADAPDAAAPDAAAHKKLE